MANEINNIILELNSSCNNNCVYCYIPEKNRAAAPENNDDYFKKVLIEFSKGTRNVDFTGGEPTLYPHLLELAGFSREAGYENRTLVTNGRMLAYGNYCRRLLGAGINRVIIPLDGPNKRIAEAITRTPGSFEQTIKAIKNMKKTGMGLGTTIVVNKLNYRHVPETIKKSLDLGADFINIQFLLPYVSDKNVPCRRIPSSIIPTYKDSTTYVKLALDRYGRNDIKVHFIPFCCMKGYERYLIDEAVKSDRMVINHRGYRYNMGEHLKRGSVKIQKCDNCLHKNKCNGFFLSYSRQFGISERGDGHE